MQPRRLSPQLRRDQLLDVGEQVYREREFESTSMEDIAEAAGVTRALVYHYFKSRAEFFGAIWARAHERVRQATVLDPTMSIREGIRAMLVTYLDFYAEHLALTLIANRSSIAPDPAVRSSGEQAFATISNMVLNAAETTGQTRTLAETAFLGWIAFVRETTLATLLDKRITEQENLAMCLAALDATVGSHADLSQPLFGPRRQAPNSASGTTATPSARR